MPSATPPPIPVRWEYKSIQLTAEARFMAGVVFDNADFTTRLNELGDEGWELVAIVAFDKNAAEKLVTAVLKRLR